MSATHLTHLRDKTMTHVGGGNIKDNGIVCMAFYQILIDQPKRILGSSPHYANKTQLAHELISLLFL